MSVTTLVTFLVAQLAQVRRNFAGLGGLTARGVLLKGELFCAPPTHPNNSNPIALRGHDGEAAYRPRYEVRRATARILGPDSRTAWQLAACRVEVMPKRLSPNQG